MASLVVLTALVGSILYASYIPNVKVAHLCLSENKTENPTCYNKMQMINLNNLSYPVFTYAVDSVRLTFNNDLKIKYLLHNNKTLTSDWISLPTNKTSCDYFFCYLLIGLVVACIIPLVGWVIYRVRGGGMY